MTKFCVSVDIHDVMTCATFCDDRLRGSTGVARGRISRFHIDLRRRPYNTLALPCECVIIETDRMLVTSTCIQWGSHDVCSIGGVVGQMDTTL